MNNRLRKRVKFNSSIEIDTEDGQKLFEDLEDISMSGFFVNNIAPFKQDKEYKFTLKLSCGIKNIEIIGKCTPVRHVKYENESKDHSKHHGIGFKITYLEPESSEELFKVISFNTLE